MRFCGALTHGHGRATGPSRRWISIAVPALLLGTLAACQPLERQPTEIPFARITIDENPPERPWYKMAGDINSDGLLDIVVAGARESLVAYLAPGWRRVEIAREGWSGVNGEIADLDGDGDRDIVMGSIVWLRNPGRADGTWEMVRIGHGEVHDIEIGDLNGDGRLDVVARNQSAFRRSGDEPGGSIVYIYLQTETAVWETYKFDCPHGEGLDLADIDGDGDPDVILGGRWYENTGAVGADSWTEHAYAAGWTEPDAKVEAADLNGDGRLDVVLTPSELQGETYKMAWYEQPASGAAGNWREHVIVPSIETVVHALGAGDIDGDSDLDIAYAEMHQGEDPDEVVILLNEGGGESWRKQVLSDDGSHDILLADFDRDGDLDIAGANHAGTHPLEFWRNDRGGSAAPDKVPK